MSLFALLGLIGTGLVGPNRSSIEEEYGLSHSAFGMGLAAVQIVAAGGVLLATHRLRRLNPFRIAMTGMALNVVGFAFVFFTLDLVGLLLGWGLIILGYSLSSILNNVSMDLWPANPRRGVILLHSYNGGGKVVGPLVAAACLAVGWRWSFLTAGGLTFVLLAAFLLVAKLPGEGYAAHTPADAPVLERQIVKRPFYWLCVLPFGLIAGGELAFATLMPTYFEKVAGLSKPAASLLLTVHLLGLVAGRFASAYLGSRASNNQIIAGCLAAGVFVFPALFAGHWLVRNASLFLMGVMFSATWPTFYAQVSRFLAGHKEMLAYGSGLGNQLGMSLCVLASSLIADANLTLSLLFGPAILWAFGALYYATRLSKAPEDAAGALLT